MNALLPCLLAEGQVVNVEDPRLAWAPVALLIVMGVGFAITNILASVIIGPGRTGPGKEETYESGMTPIGDTRQRFNVRFYIVAMIFLVFDVDIIFMYPWATVFATKVRDLGVIQAAKAGGTDMGAVLLIEMFIFVALLLVAYLYAWGKGVFKWD
jgi:NADH-quinone oxidoreductase subunit A